MQIQYLNGGLANQTFQYIFVRYAELSHPESEPWLIDDSFFFVNDVHNGYELEKVFGIKANLLSRNFDKDVWAEFIKNKKNGISIPQSFKNLGFNIQMIAEYNNYKDHNPFDGEIYRVSSNDFCPEITKMPAEIITYYHGYWLSPNWFDTYRETLLKEFAFPPIMDAKNREYEKEILSTDSVAVHIRRGDYVRIGWASKNEYYLEKTKKVLSFHPEAVFFIFSDDLPWCRENIHELGFDLPKRTVFVEGNIAGRNYIDVQLMSLCKGMIFSKSAFCSLAALLSTQMEYFVHDTNE